MLEEMSTSGRKPAQHPSGTYERQTAAPSADGTSSGRNVRRIVLVAAIVLVAIPFLMALWMMMAAATSDPESAGRGATLLLSGFTMLATGVVLLGLTPWVFSKDIRIRVVVIATIAYLLMSLLVGITLSVAGSAAQ